MKTKNHVTNKCKSTLMNAHLKYTCTLMHRYWFWIFDLHLTLPAKCSSFSTLHSKAHHPFTATRGQMPSDHYFIPVDVEGAQQCDICHKRVNTCIAMYSCAVGAL